MRRFLNILKWLLLSVVAFLVVAISGILAYRAYVQHVNAQALAIHTPNGIDEGMYVKVGGIDQWIRIRGQDRSNPVLLCLHGGPAATWTPLTALFVPWEKDFTVVQWDQRGAGKTLETTGPSVADTMSVDRMTQDGIEVSDFLRRHLQKTRIVLLGHSWGSILGVHMVRQRPDLFYAFVGTGQVADMPETWKLQHAYSLERARAAGDKKAINELEAIGPPPYNSLDKFQTHFKWLEHYETESDRVAETYLIAKLMFGAPNFTLRDSLYRAKGFGAIPTKRLLPEVLETKLISLGRDFEIPIFFFQGIKDVTTPTALARQYFETINAPHKEYVALEGGHFAVWSSPDKFLQELTARVRRWATQT
jgi:pimeloyl-ACP methyl ester carboxylesterase